MKTRATIVISIGVCWKTNIVAGSEIYLQVDVFQRIVCQHEGILLLLAFSVLGWAGEVLFY